MATAYSGEVAIGSYNRIRLRVEYSGTSATCYIEFRRTSGYTATWADSSASITFNGTTQAAPYSYSGYVGTDWVQLTSAGGFSVSTSGGTYSWSFNNPGGGSVLGCSGTISIGSQATAPTGLGINNISTTATSVSANVYVSGWGGAGDANSRYRNLSVMRTAYRADNQRRYERQYGNSTSGVITVTSNSGYGSGTVDPNTRYWLWWYATNGTYGTQSSGDSEASTTTVVTKAIAPTVELADKTSTTATISYSTTADGGYYAKNIQYSLDGGSTWVTGATVTGGAAATGAFTISNLTPATAYTVQTRVNTTAGNTTGASVSFVTGEEKKPTVFYGPAGEASSYTFSYSNLSDPNGIIGEEH